jgi:hypothetical protein
VFNYAWPDKLAVLEVNSLWAIQVGQYWGLRPGSAMAWIVAAVFVPCIVRGLWLERRSSIAIASVLYTGLVMAWAFPPVRFLVPILPFLVWFLFVGAGPLRPAIGVLTAVFLATSSVATWQLAQATQSRGGTWFDAAGVDDWRGISDLYAGSTRNSSRRRPDCDARSDGLPAHRQNCLRPDSMDPLMLYYNVGGGRWTPTPSTWRSVSACSAPARITSSSSHAILRHPDRLSARFPGSFTLVEGTCEANHAPIATGTCFKRQGEDHEVSGFSPSCDVISRPFDTKCRPQKQQTHVRRAMVAVARPK